eukprot:GHVS01102825.1.p1 GENE.GHVS01102825.1~~GHVS01102825.1.p1  ORF type:complete len:199 (-),score=36.77 GHVS01102825.1:169-684(-)
MTGQASEREGISYDRSDFVFTRSADPHPLWTPPAVCSAPLLSYTQYPTHYFPQYTQQPSLLQHNTISPSVDMHTQALHEMSFYGNRQEDFQGMQWSTDVMGEQMFSSEQTAVHPTSSPHYSHTEAVYHEVFASPPQDYRDQWKNGGLMALLSSVTELQLKTAAAAVTRYED